MTFSQGPSLWLAISLGCASAMPSFAADQKPPSSATIEQIHTTLHQQRVENIQFDGVLLPAVIEQIAVKYQVPLVLDDSVTKLKTMPKVTLSVGDVTVRQLLDIVGTCTMTTFWLDPPDYVRETPLKLSWMTRQRARQLSDQLSWKTVAVQQSERVLKALSERTDIEFANTPLDDAITFIRDFHQIPVEYQGPAERLQSPVNLKVEGPRLREVLDKMLPPLGLGYLIDQQTLRIVPLATAQTTPTTRVYSVPAWLAQDADGRTGEAVILRSIGEQGLNVQPQVSYLGTCFAVTAAEAQQGQIEKFIAEVRHVDRLLAPQQGTPHAPGKLPGE